MEFLIRVVAKVQPDAELAKQLFQVGDVVAACPDGWGWTTIERTNPEWRIVSVNLLQSTVDAITSGPADVAKRIYRRGYYLDLTKAPNPALFSGTRTQAIITLTRNQALAMVTQR